MSIFGRFLCTLGLHAEAVWATEEEVWLSTSDAPEPVLTWVKAWWTDSFALRVCPRCHHALDKFR